MSTINDREVKETHIEKRTDNSAVMSTFIKYAAYLIIFFGVLFFLVNYVFPLF